MTRLITARKVVDLINLTDEARLKREKGREGLLPGEIPFEMNWIMKLRNAGKDVFRNSPEYDPYDRFLTVTDARLRQWAVTVVDGFRKVAADNADVNFTPVGRPCSLKAEVEGVNLSLRLESIATLADGRPLYLYYHVKSAMDDDDVALLMSAARRVADAHGVEAEVGVVDAYHGKLYRLGASADPALIGAAIRELWQRGFN